MMRTNGYPNLPGYYVLTNADGRTRCVQGREEWWDTPPKRGTGWAVPYDTLADAETAAQRYGGAPEWIESGP